MFFVIVFSSTSPVQLTPLNQGSSQGMQSECYSQELIILFRLRVTSLRVQFAPLTGCTFFSYRRAIGFRDLSGFIMSVDGSRIRYLIIIIPLWIIFGIVYTGLKRCLGHTVRKNFEGCARNMLMPLQDCIINVKPRNLQILPWF